MMSTDIGLVFGFIIFFLDLLLFCIFLSRVRISFNKHILDDDWQNANDYWLKLSRVSGAMFCLFHLGIMTIVLTEILYINNKKSILHNNGVAHIYWLLQSLWILITNFAIVLITQRMFRVYKTTSTPFTPLKNWIVNHQKLIEYFIWTVYIFITLSITIQYIIIISSKPNQMFDIELSIINAIRNFCTAIILFMQLIIACFFSYIAHKSQKQTNWNEQSKSIICKETAKLAFIVLFLALIVAIIIYTASWYLANLNHKISLHMPFNNINQRIFWSILEFLGFWLILYLTRLRKPVSQHDMDIPSKTNSKLFLQRTLSSKARKKQLKQFKIEQLEKRKKQFQEREKKRKLSNNHSTHRHISTNNINNSFNTIFIKQVAKYQKEKKLKLKLLKEIQQKHTHKKSPNITEEKKIKIDIEPCNDTHAEHDVQAAKHFRQMKSDGLLHVTLQSYQPNNNNNIETDTDKLNILKEDCDTKLDIKVTTNEQTDTDINEHQPLKNKHNLTLNLKMPQMDDIDVDIDDITPVPTHVNTNDISIVSTTPMISSTPSQQYTLTPRHNYHNHHVSVVITPATHLKSSPFTLHKINHILNNNHTEYKPNVLQATFYNPESSTETIEHYNHGDDTTDFEESEHDIDDINDINNSKDRKKKDSGIGLKTIIAKIGSVFTPHPSTNPSSTHSNDSNYNKNKHIEFNKFPNVRVLASNDMDNNSDNSSGFPIQFQTDNTKIINLAPITDTIIDENNNNNNIKEEDCNNEILLENNNNEKKTIENSMDGIIDMYMDAFEHAESESIEVKDNNNNSNDDIEAPIPIPIPHMNNLSKQQSGDFTNLIGDGMFHNIHLKPTLLKRSHSDPDIRVRNKIWDQLLTAFKNGINEKNNNHKKLQLPTNGTFLGHYVSDITQELSTQNRDSTTASINNNNDNDDDISRTSHVSHQTQLSLNDNDKEFNIFGWFDHMNNNENNIENNNDVDMEIVDELKVAKSTESVESKKKKTQKSTSSKMWRNLVKKKNAHRVSGHGGHKDSLEIPVNDLPMDMIFQNNNSQQMSVKLSNMNENNKLKINTNINENNINDNNNNDNNELGDLASSSTTQLKIQTSKHRSKNKRKLKSRIRRKKQTKQWISNVHQVF